MDNIKLFFEKKGNILLTLLWSIIVVACLAIAAAFLFTNLREGEDVTFDITGSHNMDFSVYYLPNDRWRENPIPRDFNFVMAFTDFIRVNSDLTLNISEEAQINYSYKAIERLVIRQAGGDANLSPTIYEQERILSEHSGSQTTNRLRLNTEDFEGGDYTINPRPHIDTYFDFIEENYDQKRSQGLTALSLRGFSAELFIDFTYDIEIPEHGINETLTQGYRLALTNKIYSLVETGEPTFNLSIPIYKTEPMEISLPMAMVLVIIFSIAVYGLVRCINNITADPNPKKREAMTILRKYAGEIIVDDAPVDMGRYTRKNIEEFPEMIKLAINLSKHIMGYHNEEYAEFVTIVDDYAYVYRIDYNEGPAPADDGPKDGQEQDEIVSYIEDEF